MLSRLFVHDSLLLKNFIDSCISIFAHLSLGNPNIPVLIVGIEIKNAKSNLFLIEDFKKPSLLVPLSKNKFRIHSGDRDGETAIFEIDQNNVVTLKTGGGTKFRKINP